MAQQQTRFSLRSKLLLSVVFLLFLVILFLSAATIYLFQRDKQAYVYDLQDRDVRLAGNEFSNVTGRTIDTLKITLGSFDPRRRPNQATTSKLQDIINNQKEALLVTIHLIDRNTSSLRAPLAKLSHPKLKSQKTFAQTDFGIPTQDLKKRLQELKNRPYLIFNGTKPGGARMIVIAYVDLKMAIQGSLYPAAFAFVPLEAFASKIAGSNLSILNPEGWLLFDSRSDQMTNQGQLKQDPTFLAASKTKTISGAQEFEAKEGRTLSSYFKAPYDLTVISRTPWSEAMASSYELTIKFALLGLAAVGFAMVFSIFFAKSLTAPLNRLYQATKQVAAGNFSLQLKKTTSDEIGALSDSFNVMSSKINDLIEESMERVRMEGELAIASTVQQTLFPPPQYQDQNIQLRSFYQSATECGGDWWGFFRNGNKLALLIADATGHGIPSALVTASASSCFSVINKLAQEDPSFNMSPSRLLNMANRVIYDSASSRIMMTFFTAVIDFSTLTLTYSSAGHNPPWLFHWNGTTFVPKSLTAKGPRLGEKVESDPFEEKSVKIAPNDILFLYTDGIMEGTDAAGTQYGKKKVRKIVESNLSQGPDFIVNHLIQDFKNHNGDKHFDDDVTLAVARILSASGPTA